jgi:maltoporin
MAYIGGILKISEKPTYTSGISSGIVAVPNTQSNIVHFDDAYKHFVNINVDTTTTLVATNNYYVKGEIVIADTKTWDVAGTGTLNVI